MLFCLLFNFFQFVTGYKDTRFYTKDNNLWLSGNRYEISNQLLPNARDYLKKRFDIDLKDVENIEPPKLPDTYPESILDQNFLEGIKNLNIDFSIDGKDRLIRCHGQMLEDIYNIRNGKFTRIPDIVLWPKSHDEVVEIVKLANELNIVVIPFGGGTSVSKAVTCPQDETERCISVLDTSQMNRMLWLDKENLVACFEAGIVGQDLDRLLLSKGLLMGHEPDSNEFSTLGGWVATRASGMKKNTYGNIEDLVIQVKMVTSKGVLERKITAPRVSCGPDMNHIILGSEGSFGVITQVLVKVRPLPEVQKYISFVFPDFKSGLSCMREIAKNRCQPASIRLVDNEHFSFAMGFAVNKGFFARILDIAKKFALTKFKGYDWSEIAVATLVFEGSKEEVCYQEKCINEIARKHSGIAADAEGSKRGYVRNLYKNKKCL